MSDGNIIINSKIDDGDISRGIQRIKQKLGGLDASLIKTAALSGAISLGPSLIPMLATATAGALALGSSMAAAGIGAVAFGAVAVGALTQVFEASEEVGKLEEKIANADSAKERIAAQKELAAVYEGMSKQQRFALKELQNFKTFWGDFVKQFENPIFDSFGIGLHILQELLKGLAPTITNVSAVVKELLESLDQDISNGGFKQFFDWLATNAAESLRSFAMIGANVFQGFMALLQAFAPLGASTEEGLMGMTQRFKEWAQSLAGSKSFENFINYVRENVPNVLHLIGGIIKFAWDLIKALAPLGSDAVRFIGALVDALGKLTQTDSVKSLFSGIKDGIEKAKNALAPFKEAIEGVIAAFQGNEGKAISILSRIGLTPDQIQAVLGAVTTIKNYVRQGIENIVDAFNLIKYVVTTVFNFLKPYIMPIITAVVSFVVEKIAQLTQFWDENGKQIFQAIKNVFNGIMAVIKFIMPAVLAIIKMVWGNIKGVINGALKIIMGLIKVFAGLFTGDFSKMWEGIKQMFMGAIQFVWNLINLMMFGKILSGIKGFIKLSISWFKNLWTNVVNIFKNLDNNIVGVVGKMLRWLKNSWGAAKDNAVSMFTNMKNSIAKIWDNIVAGARALPGKIGSGLKAMAGKAAEGATAVANRLLRGIGKGVNGVIGGVNWVLDKVGSKTKIKKWDVPQYATGTKGHPGGPAIVGEKGMEAAHIPGKGMMMVGTNGPELLNLPKGTSVLPHKQTLDLLSAGIPGYAGGIGDFFSLLGQGAKKLAGKVWENFIPDLPKIPGAFKEIPGKALSMIKNKAFDFIKKKVDGFGDMGGSFKGGVAAPAQVKKWVIQALSLTGTSMSWLPAMLVKAQKESGFNPRAINLWDSNFRRGTPSKGLFQTIDPTFNAHKMSGMNDIYNPVHNAVAAIRYIKSRYGTVFNTPGIKSMARGGAYKGYADGGLFPANSPQLIGIGDNKKYQEAALPLSPNVLGYIGSRIAQEMPMGPSSNGDSQVILRATFVTPDGRVLAEHITPHIKEIQQFDTKKDNRGWGRYD